jgi:hypothetical protein
MVTYANISNLVNIQPLVINNSLVNDSTHIISRTIDYTNAQADWWIILVSFCLFIGIFYIVMTQNIIDINVSRSMLFTSGIIMIFNFILLLSQWVTNIYGMSIFSVIFIISLIWVWYVKQSE